jgi:hypothetical protein
MNGKDLKQVSDDVMLQKVDTKFDKKKLDQIAKRFQFAIR